MADVFFCQIRNEILIEQALFKSVTSCFLARVNRVYIVY